MDGPEEEKRYCGTRKKNGEPCKNPAGYRTDHPGWGKCKNHGGTSPALTVHAAREEAEGLVAKLRLGNPVYVDPATALVQEVYRSAGVVAYLDQMMADVTEGDLIYLTEQGYKPRAFLDVYNRERVTLAKVCAMALSAGVAERQVRIAERQGELVAGALNKILGDLGLTVEQRAIAPGVVRKHLMAISAESA